MGERQGEAIEVGRRCGARLWRMRGWGRWWLRPGWGGWRPGTEVTRPDSEAMEAG